MAQTNPDGVTRHLFRRKSGLKALLMIVGLVSIARAQVLTPRTPIVEIWRERVPLSGGPIVGLLAIGGKAKIHDARPTVYLPESHERLLFVTIRSRDGRYFAEAEYDVANLPSGSYTLDLQTGYAVELSQYWGKELAVLAQIGRSCRDKDTGTFAVTSWEATGPPGDVTLFLNIGASNRARVLGVPSGPVKCSRIREDHTTAYNTECVLSLSQNALHSLSVEQRHFRRKRLFYLRINIP